MVSRTGAAFDSMKKSTTVAYNHRIPQVGKNP